MNTGYIRFREYKPYDSQICIRLNDSFRRFLLKFNSKNVSATIRSLIRVDLYGGDIEITDKDISRMNMCFLQSDIDKIKEYIYRDKKVHRINIKLYKNEKQAIIKRADGNINNYVDLCIMDFISKIDDHYLKHNKPYKSVK